MVSITPPAHQGAQQKPANNALAPAGWGWVVGVFLQIMMNVKVDGIGSVEDVNKIEINMPKTETVFRIRLDNKRERLVITKVNDDDNSIFVKPLVANQLELF